LNHHFLYSLLVYYNSETEFCFDFHLDLFQFLIGNEIETKITEIKTNIFSEKLGF